MASVQRQNLVLIKKIFLQLERTAFSGSVSLWNTQACLQHDFHLPALLLANATIEQKYCMCQGNQNLVYSCLNVRLRSAVDIS